MQNFYYTVLATTQGSDAGRWRNLVDRNPEIDIYFTPEYATVFEVSTGETGKEFGGKAQLFFFGNEQNYIVYPFFRRKISDLPFAELLSPELKGYYDIASPYGYSGPLAYITESGLEAGLWAGFLAEFHHYCFQNNIVAEFARLHPYLKNHLPLQKLANSDVRKRPAVVYVDLGQDESTMRKNMTRGNKSSISKARHSGVQIRCSSTKDEIEAFYQLYTSTMERNNAKKAYFFNRAFFDSTFQLLGDNVKLFNAYYQDRIIAAALLLVRANILHYHLGGSDAEFLHLRPNNLLFYEAILWAKGQGYKIFNMGGGYEPNDSLFQFKSSFAKTRAEFFTHSKVHNEEIYKILCQARDEYDRLQGKDIAESDFFPQYRR